MKEKILLLLVLCLWGVSPVIKAQSGTTVTLKMDNVTLTQVLDKVCKVNGYDLIYKADVKEILDRHKVNVNEEKMPIDLFFRNLLIQYQLVADIDGKTISIQKVNFTTGGASRKKILKGVITDSEGELVAGATVVLRNTKIATISDFNGNFSIDIPDMDDPVLTISFLGMKSQNIHVEGKSQLHVKMVSDVNMLDDVVVTGYQRIRRSEMVGANTMIKGEDLDLKGTNTLEQMLQGKMPGTVVINTSGVVGTRQKVRVRGTSTLLGSQEPVWVVDGVIQTDPLPFKSQELNSLGDISEDNMDMIRNFVGSSISWLNPNDIENITVLKDASATVLYGVKAANGVIVITTKKGHKGRLSIGYHGGVSIGERITYRKMNLMNSRERNDVSREIYEKRLVSSRSLEEVGYEGLLNQYLNQQISYEEFSRRAKQLDVQNTDWFDILYRNPLSHSHSVSLSGGSEQLTYYGSVYANLNNGTQIGNNSNMYGAALRLDNKIGKNVQVSLDLAGSTGKTNSYFLIDPYKYASTTSRVIPCYNEDGSLHYYPYRTFGYKYNVLNEFYESGNENENRSFNVKGRLQWDIIDGLRFESTLGFATSNTVGHTYASERTYAMTSIRGYEYGQYTPADEKYRQSRLPHGGEYNSVEYHSLSYTWTNMLSYNKLFGKDHRLSLMIGEEVRSEKYDGLATTRYGFMPDRGQTFTTPPLTVTSANQQVNNGLFDQMTSKVTDRRTNYLGMFASASYSYKERYTATASIRTDASNRFGQDTRHRFLPVWSVGARWNAINESWLRDQNVLSDLSLRLTYGWQGNAVENYGPDLVARIPDRPIDNRTGEYILKIKSLAYPDLRWEKTSTYNIGVDLCFLRNRVQFTFEYYDKRTRDMIVELSVPTEYGVSTTPINGGRMRNTGLEFSVSATLIQTKKLNWTLSLNSAKNFNKVESEINENSNWRTAVSGALNKNGYPVQSIWAFKFMGINQENGDPTFDVPLGTENPEAVTDATAYMVHMGSLEPDFTGGLSTSFRFVDFSVSASFNLNLGGKRFLFPMFNDDIVEDVPSAYSNLPKDFVSHWRQPGDITDVPGIPSRDLLKRRVLLPTGLTESSYRMYNYSDIRVVSGSYLRCTNLGLNYFFPKKIVNRMRLGNLSLSLSVSNPFMINSKDFKGLDPEVATGNQPITRNYSFSINMTL